MRHFRIVLKKVLKNLKKSRNKSNTSINKRIVFISKLGDFAISDECRTP
ncbi:MAG: hypothetical protein ACJAT0_001643 [Nonlabens sp.]|jgi:hypothetical protein